MWDRDRSAHHQRHIKRIHKLFASHARFGAFSDVISDAIVATKDDRTGQAHQLLGLLVERAILISLGIERKKSFDAQMTTAEARHPTPLPLAPAAVLGVVYVRGRMLTLLDSAALSAGEALTWPPAVPAIISLRGDEQLALAADSFAGTITISSSDIEVSPDDEEFQTTKAVAGILRHGGEKITILDASQLFEAAVHRKERRRRRF